MEANFILCIVIINNELKDTFIIISKKLNVVKVCMILQSGYNSIINVINN